MTETIEDVLQFWLHEVGEGGWYAQDDALDARITDRFEGTWERAAAGRLRHWGYCPRGMLAFLIVTDQFPRNMFRGQREAFQTDKAALAAARQAIMRDYDLAFDGPERQFFYLPMMHAESVSYQEQGVRQFLLKMPQATDNLLHARAHREVIRKFGRFPYRNDALGRRSAPAETRYLDAGSYGATVRALQAETPDR